MTAENPHAASRPVGISGSTRSTSLDVLTLLPGWCLGGTVAGLFLVVLAPILSTTLSNVVFVTFIQLPAYLFHQTEEYYRDRFRSFVNDAAHEELLTSWAALVINILGVWCVDLIALYLAYFVRPGLGLIAAYLAMVNVVVHILLLCAKRTYNPGLVTAVVLLAPAGALGWWTVTLTGQATWNDHIIGLSVAVAVHLAIVWNFSARSQRLKQRAV